MDFLNLSKIIITLITSGIGLIIASRIFILNRRDWLNRWFATFFVSGSAGFLMYAIYHSILNNANIIIPLMITAQFFFNFNSISLTMTVFVLEKFTKVAMSFKYFGRMMILFIIMGVGYFIFIPELDTIAYANGIVNTTTNLGLSIFVNGIRIILTLYVAYKYSAINKQIENQTKKKVARFTKGVFLIVIGLLTNAIAAFLESYAEIVIEILAQILINISGFFILFGFLV